MVENVFLESEIDEGSLKAIRKVAVFCDDKFNNKEFNQVVNMFFNCSEEMFIENVIGICDEKFLQSNDLDPYYLDYEWETIYKIFNKVFDEKTIQKKFELTLRIGKKVLSI